MVKETDVFLLFILTIVICQGKTMDHKSNKNKHRVLWNTAVKVEKMREICMIVFLKACKLFPKTMCNTIEATLTKSCTSSLDRNFCTHLTGSIIPPLARGEFCWST